MDTAESEKPKVLEADTVYLLMKKDFPISRNVRAQWLIKHLETVIAIQDPTATDDDTSELEIASVLPKEGDHLWSPQSSCHYLYKVSTTTKLKFLAYKYKMVFSLDLSPSLATINIQTGEIVIDEINVAMKRCLEGLTKPFVIPGSQRVLFPEIYVTVIVHTPFFTNPAQQVLIQGWLVTAENVASLMQAIEYELNLLEEKVAQVTSLVNSQLELSRAESEKLVGGLFEESNIGKNNSCNNISKIAMVCPETSFVNMLRYGMLALSLLPEHSCSHLVIVSDGIVGVNDIHVMESVIQQLRTTTIACNFLHVGSSYHPHSANGLVPYTDLLRFIALATLGSYMSTFPIPTDTAEKCMNVYHENLLCWQLYRSDDSELTNVGSSTWHTENTWFYGHEPQLLKKKQIDDQVTCTLNSLLCCRLREGYLIKRTALREGSLEICFVLPWKTHVFIEYLVTCPRFTRSLSVCTTIQYSITIEAPYEFLHDLTCLSKKPLKSQYRQSMVWRFWSALTSLTESDQMLAHFSWFPGTGWTWYNVPDTIRSGMPVFYLPTSSSSSIQLSDAVCPQFSQIWHPVVSLEPHQWPRWLHSQRVTLVLLHDRPLLKHLHQANQSGRFQSVQYRQAAAILYGMLKSWATFVLVENHTYVQFIYREPDKPPISFSLISVNCKALCVVLDVAFAGGTEGRVRYNVMTELLERLDQLSLPSRKIGQAEVPCCIILHKALEKILIKYERLPTDLSTVVFPDGSQIIARNASIAGGSLTMTLSRYLYHMRWLWLLKRPSLQTVPEISLPKLNITSAARILSTITKIRLAEGFNFAYSSAGILNTVMEVQMKGTGKNEELYPCIMQYILFPPHKVVVPGLTQKDSGSDEETDEDLDNNTEETESNGDLEIAMEVWIEPQCGYVHATKTRRASYMHSFEYNQLPNAICAVDKECINALLTLEYLSLMCQDSSAEEASHEEQQEQQAPHQAIAPAIQTQSGVGLGKTSRRPLHPDAADSSLLDNRIRSMQFDFDVLGVLPKFQQAELFFSMFADDGSHQLDGEGNANQILMDNLLNHIKILHVKELLLSAAESDRFTRMLASRPRDEESRASLIDWGSVAEGPCRPRWRCFVKGISVTHVLVTLLPASESDVPDASALAPRERPAEESRTAGRNLVLPIYVYDCSLALLVDALVEKLERPRPKDICRNYTFRPAEREDEPAALGAGERPRAPSAEPKSEDSDNVVTDQRTITDHCQLLNLAHCNAYVVAVYKSLARQRPLSHDDMDAAVEQCEEHLLEVPVTDYLRAVCRHFDPADEPDEAACSDMANIHKLIKNKFKKIINVAFRQVPVHPDFYYCLPAQKPAELEETPPESSESESDDDVRFSFNLEPPSERKTNSLRRLERASSLMWSGSDLPKHSKLSESSDSAESDSSDGQINQDEDQPLFLQLNCSIHAKSKFYSNAINLLPTCFTEITRDLEHYNLRDKSSSDLKVTLDIICLHLPQDVLQISSDHKHKNLRTTSYCSEGSMQATSETGHENEHDNEYNNLSNIERLESSDIEPMFERISDLPLRQFNAVKSFVDEIRWLLKDETTAVLLDKTAPTEETLEFVANHVAVSNNRDSCCMDKVPLHFVFSSDNSLPRFIEEVKKLTIDREYCIRQEGSLFYFVKQQVHQADVYDQMSDEDEYLRNRSIFLANKSVFLDESSKHAKSSNVKEQDSSEPLDSHSKQSSLGNSFAANDDGYEGGTSDTEDEDEYQWLVDLDQRRDILPNFWLILRVESDHVYVYFHCRFLEITSPVVERYRQVHKACVAEIKSICRKVNQFLLLRDLHDRRICDPLLEPETMEDHKWKGNENNMDTSLLTLENNQDDLANITPGILRCPIVWENLFSLHHRLKTGPGKTGLSRGIKALQTVLNRFSVSNRANMFVYQESNGNVFYLRLHERTSEDRPLQSNKLSDSDEKLIVSRSSSVASLSQAKSLGITSDQPSFSTVDADLLRPRVKSFGEKESIIFNRTGDSITLMVHGISEVGTEVSTELVQVLQNRLDDAVLEVLSVMLARNPMCKLTPSDVHFIQRQYSSPESVIRLSVQQHCLRHMKALAYYLRQNILQFLYTPKYTDPRQDSHFQDYSQLEGSSKRVPETDIFLYNQSQSSGSRGIACIAVAIVNDQGDVIVTENEKIFDSMLPSCPKIKDFEKIVASEIYWGENCEKKDSHSTKAYIEFRIWKQGRVNVESLVQKLRAAVRHANWDLITEYTFLPTSLAEPLHADDSETTDISTNPSDLNCYELGEKGKLSKIYHTTVSYWFQFGLDISVPAIKKHVIKLERQHSLPIILKELQTLVHNHAPDTLAQTFVQWRRQPFLDLLDRDKLLLSKSVEIVDGNIKWLSEAAELENTDDLVFLPRDSSKDNTGIYTRSILIARNFNQWKASFSDKVNADQLIPKDQKLLQNFNPSITEYSFVPRQRLLLAKVQSRYIILYMYNWSKERSEKLIQQVTNLGLWLSSRANLQSSVIMQKLGIFYHRLTQECDQEDQSNSPYYHIHYIDSLAKFSNAEKEWQRMNNRVSGDKTGGNRSWNVKMGDIMRDAKPTGQYNSTDPVVRAGYDYHQVRHKEKKTKDDWARLNSMYQYRGSAPISQATLNTFKQHSRLIHYCQTPLLFLPSWRLQSAATRDHSLTPPLLHSIPSISRPRTTSDATDKKIVAEWHKEICLNMFNEYNKYLQVLGFNSLLIESNQQGEAVNQSFYLKKAVTMGGVLLFEIHFSEPFFIVKLRVIEHSRFRTDSSRRSLNNYVLSFVDECDKVKVKMHLHSFTYDFHLRCIHAYIAGNGQLSLKHGYHLTNFLDDFNKYYNKAPNYARNLIYSGDVKVSDLITPAHTLYQYLLSHEKAYGMQVFSMSDEVEGEQQRSEYVLVKLQSTPLVSYYDAQDKKYTNDFDVGLIVTWSDQYHQMDSREITLKYYLMLTSKRELFPKRDVDSTDKIGKFRTVYSRSATTSQIESPANSNPPSISSSSYLGAKSKSEQMFSPSDLLLDEGFDKSEIMSEKSDKQEEHVAAPSAPTPPPVPETPLAPHVVAPTSTNRHTTTLSQIREESINYLGYYSSHEQLMQELIMARANAAQQHIRNMIEQGALHCRIHLLWNRLLEKRLSPMTYAEFAELRSLACIEPLSSLDPKLTPLIQQPISWYQSLAKLLQNKYQEYHKQFNAPDGNITHHIILHPKYVQAFMMLTIDLHTSRGVLYAVYTKSEQLTDTSFTIGDVYDLIEDFVNTCCFHLWVGFYS